MNVLLVEDEASVARRTERVVREILGVRLTRLKILNKLDAALLYLREHSTDLLLLDLNLNGKDGFALLQSLTASSFSTIVVSAYRDKAIEAFEYGVLDFVAKPFSRERLEKAINRYLTLDARNEHRLKSVSIRKQGRIQLVAVEDILYLKGADVYTELHLQSGKKELASKSMDRLLQLLPPSFERVHKSYGVQMAFCREIVVHSGGQYRLRLADDQLVPLGRSKYKMIRDRYFS